MADGNTEAGMSSLRKEFACKNCYNDGENTEAELFCVMCDENYCHGCVKQHDHVLKNHTILKIDALKTVSEHRLTDYCEEHPNNTIMMYCEGHDTVCCTRCIPEFHKFCIGVDTVYRYVDESLQGELRKDVVSALSADINEVKQRITLKTIELSELNIRKHNILKEVQNFKMQIFERVEEIEKTSVKEILLRHHENTDKIDKDVAMLNDALQHMESRLNDITHFNGENEAQLFVHVKQGHKLASDSRHLMEHIANAKPPDEYSFNFNHEIQYLLDGIKSFGEIENVNRHEYNNLHFVDHNIDVKAHETRDKFTCSISHVCELENGNIVLTDIRNQKLKELDSAFRVIDTIDLPGKPFGVCQTGSSEVAVTLCGYQEVQFISLDSKLTKTRSFTVYENCRGLCYSQHELFITCGGLECESTGQIKVYNINGKLLRSFQTYQSGVKVFSVPVHIAISSDGSTLYVADKDNGLVILSRRGLKHNVTSDTKLLKGAQGVCVDANDQVFVGCCSSRNIIQLDRRGNIMKEVVNYWLKTPVSINYLPSQKRLVLTCQDWNKIRVFQLS